MNDWTLKSILLLAVGTPVVWTFIGLSLYWLIMNGNPND